MTSTIIFGLHSVEMLLKKNPQIVLRLYFQNERHDQRIKKIIELAEQHQIATEFVSKAILEKQAKSKAHQGAVAEIKEASDYSETDLFELLEQLDHPPLLLILDGVQDPHNLGACLRSADAAGVDAVIVPKDRAVGLTPVVRKVASGAAESVPLMTVTNLARTLKALQEKGVWLVGSTEEADQPLYDVEMTGAIGIVAGGEGDGMRRLTKEICDYLVNIPMQGVVSSLNVSVAVGVLLFEAVKQRIH